MSHRFGCLALAFAVLVMGRSLASAQTMIGKTHLHELESAPSFEASFRRDALSDPLPKYAIARFGSRRLRHEAAVSILFSADAKNLVSFSETDVRVWNIQDGQELPWMLQSPSADDKIAQVFLDDNYLCTRLANGVTQRWQLTTGKLIEQGRAIGPGQARKAEERIESADGKLRATLNAGIIRIERTNGERLHAPSGHDAAILGLAISSDGKRLASVDRDGQALLWDVSTGKIVQRWRAAKATCVALSADGRRLALGASGIRVFDAEAGREIVHLQAHGDRVFALAFAPDGKRLLSAGSDNLARLWDSDGWKEIRQFTPRKPRDAEHTDRPWTVLFSPDGTLMAVCAGDDEETNLWPADPAQPPVRIARHWPIAFTPDGVSILTQNHFGHLSQRSTATGREGAYSRTLGWLASPDGKRLLCRGPDRRELVLRDWQSDETLLGVHGQDGAIGAGIFSSDGRWLFTASNLGTIVQWDLARGLDDVRMERHWSVLLGSDDEAAAKAAATLTARPEETVAFLKERVQPVGSKEISIKRLIADLDHVRYPVRQEASRQLEKLGALAAAELKAAVEKPPSLEFRRRAEALLVKLGPAQGPLQEERAAIRVVAIMERLATPESRELLRKLASGYPEAPTTRAAEQALGRLNAKASKK